MIFTPSAIHAIRLCGDILQYALPIAVGIRAFVKGQKHQTISLATAASIQQVVLNILKESIKTPRPYPHHMRLDSFPSGHTAGAFLAVGFTLGRAALDPKESSTAYKISILAAAVFVGISRYISQMHWVVDILGGGGIGLILGASSVLLPYLTERLHASTRRSQLYEI